MAVLNSHYAFWFILLKEKKKIKKFTYGIFVFRSTKMKSCILHLWGPQGFWGSGEKGYLSLGSWGALLIILGELGEQAHTFGDLGSIAKK